jgi:hypothetical protein
MASSRPGPQEVKGGRTEEAEALLGDDWEVSHGPGFQLESLPGGGITWWWCDMGTRPSAVIPRIGSWNQAHYDRL